MNARDRWCRCETWHFECGPGSTQLTPDEMIASSMRAQAKRYRVSKIHTGGGKKVRCPSCFVVLYPNSNCFQSVILGSTSIDGFVRVAWKLVEHSSACDEVTSTRVSKGAIRMFDEFKRRNLKHSDTEIVKTYKRAVRSAQFRREIYRPIWHTRTSKRSNRTERPAIVQFKPHRRYHASLSGTDA